MWDIVPNIVAMPKDSQSSVMADRALSLVEWLARNPGTHGVREIARALAINKSTAHRLLGTLARRGWARQTPGDQKYGIGLKVLSLGSEILRRTTLLDAAGPIARDLASASSETIFVGVPEGTRVVFVHKIDGNQPIRFDENVGATAYLHTSAIGKAILATMTEEEVERVIKETGLPRRTTASITHRQKLLRELAKIRTTGVAESDEENYAGALGVAAAFYDQLGNVAGAITIAGPKTRMNDARAALANLVRDAARRISAELGYSHPSGSPAPGSPSKVPLRSPVNLRKRVRKQIQDGSAPG
jgi:DNA-binding IclR family transcriptional regulator